MTTRAPWFSGQGYRARRLRRKLMNPAFAAVYLWTLYRLRKHANSQESPS